MALLLAKTYFRLLEVEDLIYGSRSDLNTLVLEGQAKLLSDSGFINGMIFFLFSTLQPCTVAICHEKVLKITFLLLVL